MKKYTSDKYALRFLRLILFLLLLVLGAAAAYFLRPYRVILTVVAVVLATAYVAAVIIILPMYFKRMKYTVSRERITAHAGVLYKITQNMKLTAVQYTTLISIPLLRRCGFNFVIVNALGGRTVLAFLSERDAADIQSRISRYMNEWGDGNA